MIDIKYLLRKRRRRNEEETKKRNKGITKRCGESTIKNKIELKR